MRLYLFPLFLLVIILSSCSKKEEAHSVAPPKKVEQPKPKPVQPDTGMYSKYYLSGSRSLSDLSDQLGKAGMFIVYKLNRRDLKHLKEGETIVIPNRGDSEMTYSPFPLHIAKLDSVKKILFVSRKVQAFAAYDSGNLVRWGPTSTGKKATPTPAQLFHTNWKSLETHSTVNEAWILKWYFNLDNTEGISLHEYDLPGYPASHSCVRLLSEDAEWIYYWGEQWELSPDRKTVAKNGTPVVVFGEYAYGKNPPWKKLAEDVQATDIPEKEINEAIDKYLPKK
jgi:hypothetical protein